MQGSQEGFFAQYSLSEEPSKLPESPVISSTGEWRAIPVWLIRVLKGVDFDNFCIISRMPITMNAQKAKLLFLSRSECILYKTKTNNTNPLQTRIYKIWHYMKLRKFIFNIHQSCFAYYLHQAWANKLFHLKRCKGLVWRDGSHNMSLFILSINYPGSSRMFIFCQSPAKAKTKVVGAKFYSLWMLGFIFFKNRLQCTHINV